MSDGLPSTFGGFPSTLPAAVLVHPALEQATSDEDMIQLWLGNFRSRNTRAAYALDIHYFLWFVAKPLRTVVMRDVQAFGVSIGHLSPASIARRLSGVKSLIAMAHRIGYLAYDVGSPVQLPALKDSLAERILSEPDVQRFLWMEDDPRNAALLRLIYSAGLRISEACGLRWRDLTPREDSGQCTIFGKGGKTRVVRLTPSVWDRVTALRGNSGPDDPVFLSRSHQPLGHAHVSHALSRGAPVHVVQATVGHASLQTTTRYSHVMPDESSARYLVA